MNLMVICVMLGVLLCTAILCIAMLSGLLTKEIDDRAADKRRYDRDLREARQAQQGITVTHYVEYAQAARYFYDQEKESAAGAANTDDAQ